MSSKEKTYRFIVTGLVQGVGFRYFVQEEAKNLGISGFVRNLADGSVESVAVLDNETKEVFESILKTGPIGSMVENVECQEYKNDINPTTFEIVR